MNRLILAGCALAAATYALPAAAQSNDDSMASPANMEDTNQMNGMPMQSMPGMAIAASASSVVTPTTPGMGMGAIDDAAPQPEGAINPADTASPYDSMPMDGTDGDNDESHGE
ncbi:MAG: hypothetical protein GC129_06625 [Proteobacteria bacterium]|nr:hypothetical protein [Pseudomonadota bacterium]